MAKIKELSVEEKEKLIDRIKIEVEDIPTTVNPVEQFLVNAETYNRGMEEQIERINTSLPLHYQIKDEVFGQLNGLAKRAEYMCNYNTSDEALETELRTREEIISRMLESRALMEARLLISDDVIKFVKNHFEDIVKLDLYFGCVLNIEATRERVEEIIKNVEQ